MHLTDDELFGQVRPRTELSAKERSLVTVSVMAALGASEQLTYHLGLAKQNGNTDSLRVIRRHFSCSACGEVGERSEPREEALGTTEKTRTMVVPPGVLHIGRPTAWLTTQSLSDQSRSQIPC